MGNAQSELAGSGERADQRDVGDAGRRQGPRKAPAGLSLLGIGLGNLYPMGMSVTVALAPERAALASGRAVMMTSFAGCSRPSRSGRWRTRRR